MSTAKRAVAADGGLAFASIQWKNAALIDNFLGAELADHGPLWLVDNGNDGVFRCELNARLDHHQWQLAANEGYDANQLLVVDNVYNLGFGAALEQLFARALDGSIEWLWVINSDARPATNALETLLACLPSLPPAVYGMEIVDREGRLIANGGYHFNVWTSRFRPIQAGESIGDRGYFSGESFLIHRRCIAALQANPSRFKPFLFYEELDMTRRLKSAGFSIGQLPVAIEHVAGGSDLGEDDRERRAYHAEWSLLRFALVNEWRLLPMLALRAIAKVLSFIAGGRGSALTYFLNAQRDALCDHNRDRRPVEQARVHSYARTRQI
ncbi:glycosyltransferase [Gammaproteobacteria bacterium]|nr:glycosyltransferase [Gammaproteobacteria bacterium]